MTNTRSALYAGDGSVFSHYLLNAEQFTLEKEDALRLSGPIQYAWPHASLPVIYVASSTVAAGRSADEPLVHALYAIKLDPSSGDLSLHGQSVDLPHRAVHISTDPLSEHVLVAYNIPAQVDVFETNEDGTLGELVEQRGDIDFGIYPHQVRVTPDSRRCIVIARGNPPKPVGWWAAKGPQTDPGSLNVFRYDNGVLGEQITLSFDDGFGFGPRHLDFHPTNPWIYLSVETQNEVIVLGLRDDGTVDPTPLQRLSSLKDPDALQHQVLGPVHVHPAGHVVYFANRVYEQMPYRDGKKIAPPGSENSIVVYSIDASSGLLTEVQRIETGGINPRTFAIDPTASMLVIANSVTQLEKSGDRIEPVLKNLAVFEIAKDGCLEFRRAYDQEAEPTRSLTWAGIVAL